MQSRPYRPYRLWSARQDTEADGEKVGPLERPSITRVEGLPTKPHTGKLKDLQTSMLLYRYGLPIEIALDAACTLRDGQSLSCKTKSISSEAVELSYTHAQTHSCHDNDIGSAVQLNLDEVGSVEGKIASQNRKGFQVSVHPQFRASLGNRLAHLALRKGISRDIPIASGLTTHRIELDNKKCCFTDHKGCLRNGIIVNLSRVEILLRAPFTAPRSEIILFKGPKRYAAKITNVFAIGFMARFSTPISDNDFSAQMQFTD